MNTTLGPKQAIRILIADDHELARGGLRSFFLNDPSFAIVAEAADGETALQLCEQLRPDLALLDIRMGQSSGLAVTRLIRQRCPGVHVVIVTMHEDVQYLLEAIKEGAEGYLIKDAPRSEFLSAVRKVVQGEQAFCPQLMIRALQSMSDPSTSKSQDIVELLTPREQDVLTLVVGGQTNRQIAAALRISPGTVKVHVEHIIAKLGVADRTQAAVRAVELGLTTSPWSHGSGDTHP